MPSLSPTIPRSGESFKPSLSCYPGGGADAVPSLNRSGSNGFRSFAGYKDDKYNGANFNSHSCDKVYYYI